MQINESYTTQSVEPSMEGERFEVLNSNRVYGDTAYEQPAQARIENGGYEDVTASLNMDLLRKIMDPNYSPVPVSLTKPMDYSRLQTLGWNSYSSFLVDRIGSSVVAKRYGV